jgi:hypothetical protein
MFAQTFGLPLGDKVSWKMMSNCEWKVRRIVSRKGEDNIETVQTFENRKKVQNLV